MCALYVDSGDVKLCSKSLHLREAELAAGITTVCHDILECDPSGFEYTNTHHDITIKIPEGATAGRETIHFEIAVVMYGPFIFQQDCQPVSPILWLCIVEENYELKKPLQITLPHFLIGVTEEKARLRSLTFAKASHTDRHPQGYDFHQSANHDDNTFLSIGNRNYGILLTYHCCFLCIQEKVTRESVFDAGYCLARVESVISPQTYEVYFCAMYLLRTCLKVRRFQLVLL